MKAILFYFTFSLVITYCKLSVVCSLDELLEEIAEDLADNGKLDCLRNNFVPSDASPEMQIKIKNANWDSDCSFEAEGNDLANWQIRLRENYNLKKGLVDVNGDTVYKDFDDQADLCEIIRSFVANGLFAEIGEDVKFIPMTLIDYISCPGMEYQSQICAVNEGSFNENSKWYIPLDGQTIRINGEPEYIQKNK